MVVDCKHLKKKEKGVQCLSGKQNIKTSAILQINKYNVIWPHRFIPAYVTSFHSVGQWVMRPLAG